MMKNISIAIHGGAGTILKKAMTPDKENEYKMALQTSLNVGYDLLDDGSTAIEAVEKAVSSLEDNREVGAVAAEMFDEIIIRQDKHLRGKTEEELIEMIHDGIKSVDPNKPVTIIPSEEEAITHAITNAKKGSLLVFCTDVVPDALNLVMSYKEKESKEILEN